MQIPFADAVQDIGFIATNTLYSIARSMAKEGNSTGFLTEVKTQKAKIDAELEKVIDGLI